MAVGADTLPELLPVDGVRIGIASAGIKTAGKNDLTLFELAEGSAVASVFTLNAFCAAPVQLAKQHLTQRAPRYLLINTGNANAGTGEPGMAAARRSCEAVADLVSLPPQSVLPFSTGVIGELLPVDRLINAVPDAINDLQPDHWQQAAAAILTTDTRPKGACRQLEIDGQTVTITGIAKGSGMIQPNMATMLAYVATDLAVDDDLWQRMLSSAVERSFNRISVDGDTSTNDACVAVATGRSGGSLQSDADVERFTEAFDSVCLELAQAIVRDGEGATKFVSIEVGGGRNEVECLDVAYTIAHSPLVKTALFASDPNWGRLLAAIGRAGLDGLDVDRVRLHLNDVLIAEQGARAASYTEEQGQAVMNEEEIRIQVDLGRGDAEATVWTTDLSHDYVRINAEYRT